MKEHNIFYAILFVIILFAAASARAEEPEPIPGDFGNWAAYVFMEDGSKVCYMASQPKKQEGKFSRRGDVFALITHRPAEGSHDVFSYITGYSYKSGSDASVKIGGDSFTLFTQDDTAWAPNDVVDGKIAAAIRKGADMVVKGTSARGTQTTDTFSLKGSGAAYDAITKKCGD